MMSTIPVAMMATTAVWTDIVTMLAGWRILPPVYDAEADQDGDQGDEHAEQAEIDLRGREHAPHGQAPGASCRLRCGAGQVSHAAASDPGVE